MKPASQGSGSLTARMLLGEKLRIQKGYLSEGCIVQKCAGSKTDVLPFAVVDYPGLVEAVSLYEHQGRRGSILDGKDYFDVPRILHKMDRKFPRQVPLPKVKSPELLESFNR